MVAMKMRQVLVYLATGLFFLVAATCQLQGASVTDTVVKAAISCAVVVALGLALVYVVEDAEKKQGQAARRAPMSRAAGTQDLGEQAGNNSL